ncbi:MAG TPA: universal stress protein [Acidobacteriaceae bacterium]|jgi:nucleotide-binding universal stress UspA family protein|nr:universal stress protein [Acidobacteriaceae bacterium]
MFKKIAVAYDESAPSEHALATAISLAASLGSSLRIVTVIEPLPGYVNMSLAVDPTLPQQLLNERRERLKQVHELAVKHASGANVKAETALLDGPEVDSILSEVAASGADLLVIGLSQHHGFGEFTSTVHRIGLQVSCPVLAVH